MLNKVYTSKKNRYNDNIMSLAAVCAGAGTPLDE